MAGFLILKKAKLKREAMEIKKKDWYILFIKKINDDHFYNALKVMLCAVLSFVLFYTKFGSTVSFGLILGATLCTSVDTSSSLRSKIIGIGVISIAVPVLTILLTLLYAHSLPFYVFFACVVFCSALLPVYGQRATQMSFSLLLGICMAFMHVTNVHNAMYYSLYIFLGGLMYAVVSILFYLCRPTKFINIVLSNYMDNIADFLVLRADLWGDDADISLIRNKQLVSQVALNNSFKQVNQSLDLSKSKFIDSEHNKKLVLMVSFLNELRDVAISTTFTDSTYKGIAEGNPQLKHLLQEITASFATTVSQLANSLKLQSHYSPTNDLTKKFNTIKESSKSLMLASTELHMRLNSVLDYLSRQIKIIQALEHTFKDKIETMELPSHVQEEDVAIQPAVSRFKILLNNLNFASVNFKYALRVTLALLLGLVFGNFVSLQKEYWVFMTIVVVMRPGYGLTKNRMLQRVAGTIIGGVVGILILHFVKDTLLLGLMTALAIFFGYWLSSSNYRVGVMFNTLYIVLLYGILKTSVEISIYYRIVDTLTGAIIALLATSFLWPTWEFKSVKQSLIASTSAIIAYVNDLKTTCFEKEEPTNDSEKTRQNAFIVISNLMASYQRLIQEPKAKQKYSDQLHKITLISQTLVGTVAGLGSFLQSYQKGSFSSFYTKMLDTLIYNLDSSLRFYGQSSIVLGKREICTSSEISNMQLKIQKNIDEVQASSLEQKEELIESQMILNQLTWTINLSEQILKLSKEFKED